MHIRFPKTKKSTNKTMEKNLYSKLLYYSIAQCTEEELAEAEAEEKEEEIAEEEEYDEQGITKEILEGGTYSTSGKKEDRPQSWTHPHTSIPSPSTSFLHTCHWQFRDLDILVGSDIMVFRTDQVCPLPLLLFL